jgi:hypothetical protein
VNEKSVKNLKNAMEGVAGIRENGGGAERGKAEGVTG